MTRGTVTLCCAQSSVAVAANTPARIIARRVSHFRVMPTAPPIHRPPGSKTAREQDRARGSSTKRGYDARWQKARAAHLAAHPLCVHCQAQGRVSAAILVDHVVPHHGDRFLFWLLSNWQSLCAACHATKGVREAGLAPCTHALEVDVETLGAVCALCGARQAARCA